MIFWNSGFYKYARPDQTRTRSRMCVGFLINGFGTLKARLYFVRLRHGTMENIGGRPSPSSMFSIVPCRRRRKYNRPLICRRNTRVFSSKCEKTQLWFSHILFRNICSIRRQKKLKIDSAMSDHILGWKVAKNTIFQIFFDFFPKYIAYQILFTSHIFSKNLNYDSSEKN